jgi:hypothetical protein
LAASIAGVLLAAPAAAQPVPPCAGPAVPAAAEVGPLPAIEVWEPGSLTGWHPPGCLGWDERRQGRIVATAGRIRAKSMEEILGRLGAISRQREIDVWSVESHDWRPLLADATALEGANPDSRRGDLAPAEFAQGALLHLLYDDSQPIGPVVYEFAVRERTDARIVLSMRNISPAKAVGLTLGGPGDILVAIFLERESASLWRYYSLSHTNLAVPFGLGPGPAEFRNRAAAMFRFAAGLPTDTMPPAESNELGGDVEPASAPLGGRSD